MRILILDDAIDFRVIISEMMTLAGHTTASGYNGQDGLTILAESGSLPDMIICDRRMPVMDGLEFVQYVRENRSWSKIPILMISGLASDEEQALEAGADSFLVKPFRYSQLETLINQLCSAATL